MNERRRREILNVEEILSSALSLRHVTAATRAVECQRISQLYSRGVKSKLMNLMLHKEADSSVINEVPHGK